MRHKLAVIAQLLLALPVYAAIELPPLISDRMVLQAGTEVPIWGKAGPKEKIKVSFRGKALSVVADASGDWKIVLPKMERDTLESKGSELVISAGGETKRVRDVLVGEVWLGAGQSNMHTPLNEYWTDPATPALKDGKFPLLRLRKMDQLHQKENWGWWAATDWRNGAFSAQLIGFGVRLMKHFNCPVGLIEAGSNGSPSGPFLSKEGFLASGEIARMIEKNPNLAKYADKVGWHWRGMIKPCVPFAVKGIYWDQGEGGTEMPEIYQPVVMRAIVASWRKAWGRDLPWIYVQKPSGGGCALDPENPFNKGSKACEALPENVPGGSWHASLRGDGYDIARMSGVYLLVNSDLSPGVHPPIKSSYADRGFRIALANVYGEKVEWTGPMFVKVAKKSGKVAVLFDHTAEGLCVPKGTELQGFALAGADGEWAWAKGEIKGKNRVVLSVPAGMNPVRIRYATQWPCAWANLFNSEGFPALGFESEIK